ncbi:MAG: hypothetical protein ABJH28_03450 [Paraglaciecola sp.]|uniref:hypothetical protein n=1 Tax=Paraglaciecola sp. TaxID=1920173 RepID=UPI003263DAC9
MRKRIVIHVGPPKTGTSAIQNWFASNREELMVRGLYYPPHNLDPNGISSGHLRNICDVSTQEVGKGPLQVTMNCEKILQLINDFKKTDAHTLFLSSEYFCQHLFAIKKIVPEAIFLAYIRNPIELLESNYNQGIKRNGFTHKLNPETFKCFPHVSQLTSYRTSITDDSLKVRYFDSHLNRSSSLICDVLDFLNIDGFSIVDSSPYRINSSYNFEALEIKRWFNNFDLGIHKVEVDHVLQSFNLGLNNYSLLPAGDYQRIAEHFSQLVKPICLNLGLEDGELFSESILMTKQPQSCEQVIDKFNFLLVVNYLKNNMGTSYLEFYQNIMNNRTINNEEYFKWFYETKPDLYFCWKFKLKERARKIFLRGTSLKPRAILKYLKQLFCRFR